MLPPISTSATPVNIIIADDQPIFRKGFSLLFKNQTSINVIGEASDGKELLHAVEKKNPHLIITDIRMPVMDGIEATKQIKKRFPGVEIIALFDLHEDHFVFEMLGAGAKGFLLKNTYKEEILMAVKIVNEKGTYYCNTITNQVLRRMSGTSNKSHTVFKKPRFSEKEVEVIKLICQEYSSKEIADKLEVNPRAVESTRERIQEKTGARNMIGIAVYAIRNGIYCVD